MKLIELFEFQKVYTNLELDLLVPEVAFFAPWLARRGSDFKILIE